MGLVGPPELYNQSQPEVTSTTGDSFVDLMLATFNERASISSVATETSSGNPCVDFFFLINPPTHPRTLVKKLELAWLHDPLTTLKLIFNLREIRGQGKSDDEGFFTAAFWLHRHHPQTLAANVSSIAELGRYKDLPELIFRLLEGVKVRHIRKAEWIRKKGAAARRRASSPPPPSQSRRRKKARSAATRDIRVSQAEHRSQTEKEKAKTSRDERRVAMAKKVTDRLRSDADFRRLYEKISDCFAERLKSDLEALKRGDLRRISMAAKWCPSVDSSYDRSTLLCESIGRKMFPREVYYKEEEGLEEAHYAFRVRDRLRKEVLVPLRKIMDLPETFICAGKWDEVKYNRVSSVAMERYKDKFTSHDFERFTKYLDDVESGTATISAGALLPHKIMESVVDGEYEDGRVAELQWRRMVEDLRKSGALRNCLAVTDMSCVWMSAPLGLLVSELADEPWKGKIVTFGGGEEDPRLHVIKGEDAKSRMEFVNGIECSIVRGKRPQVVEVMNLILESAVAAGLPEEMMVRRVFVFSNDDFDDLAAGPGKVWEREYDAVVSRFRERGYGKVVPEIVYWCLVDRRHRNSRNTVPAAQRKKGVALVSGYSKNMLRLFLNNDGDISPEAAMKAAISGSKYDQLVLVD